MQRLQQQQPQYQTRKEIVEAEGGGGGSSGEEGADFDSDDEGENDSFGEEEDEEDQRQNVAMQGRKALLKLASCDSSDDEEKEDEETSSSSIKAKPAVKLSTDEVIVKNRQRVLILSSRGIVHRYRHLLNDLHVLMPHSKKESKLDTKKNLSEALSELCEMTNCNNCVFFEVRKHTDLYMWMGKMPNGPSVKFFVQNVHTMDELRMTGNCLKGSRPILSFDSNFNVALANPTQNDSLSHLPLLKELFVHTFATPRTSRKIKPFVDRVMQFSFVDGRIWVRNYQIVKNEGKEDVGAVLMEGGEEEKVVDEKKDVGAKKQESKKRKSPVGGKFDKEDDVSLVEIGPRFVLNVIRIFDGSFGGRTLYENPEFVSPNMVRRQQKEAHSDKYIRRSEDKLDRHERLQNSNLPIDPVDSIYTSKSL